jgi:formylglycine-generating enzyme required for sulfatase activity
MAVWRGNAADGACSSPMFPWGCARSRCLARRAAVSHIVSVVKGRTVPATPDTVDGGSPPPPTVTPAGKNAEGFQEYRRARDGAIMVQIPEGEFPMGNLETEGAPLPHTVHESSFLIDKLPLTVGPFKRFAAATGRPLPPDPYWGVHDDFPVAFIRWDEAKAYCEWAGGRLPTEAEREKATRGTDGRLWPWGSEPPTPARGVFRRNWGQEGNDAVGTRARTAPALTAGYRRQHGSSARLRALTYSTEPWKTPPGTPAGRGRRGVVGRRPTVLSASSWNLPTSVTAKETSSRCASDLPR